MSHTEKPSHNEDDYFAREEVELKRKLAYQQSQSLVTQERERLKALHHMKCPRCGMDLQAIKKGKVEVDACFSCHGIFLEAGELEQLHELMLHEKNKGGQWMSAVLNIFKNK